MLKKIKIFFKKKQEKQKFRKYVKVVLKFKIFMFKNNFLFLLLKTLKEKHVINNFFNLFLKIKNICKSINQTGP